MHFGSAMKSAATDERKTSHRMPVPEAFWTLLCDEGYGVDLELGGWEFSA